MEQIHIGERVKFIGQDTTKPTAHGEPQERLKQLVGVEGTVLLVDVVGHKSYIVRFDNGDELLCFHTELGKLE